MNRFIFYFFAFSVTILLSACIGREGSVYKNGETTTYSTSRGLGLEAADYYKKKNGGNSNSGGSSSGNSSGGSFFGSGGRQSGSFRSK